jgi:hypothetical protein
MSKRLKVPENLRESFNRTMDLVPSPFKNDIQVQKDILLFLKLEGESYVQGKIKKAKDDFIKNRSKKL